MPTETASKVVSIAIGRITGDAEGLGLKLKAEDGSSAMYVIPLDLAIQFAKDVAAAVERLQSGAPTPSRH